MAAKCDRSCASNCQAARVPNQLLSIEYGLDDNHRHGDDHGDDDDDDDGDDGDDDDDDDNHHHDDHHGDDGAHQGEANQLHDKGGVRHMAFFPLPFHGSTLAATVAALVKLISLKMCLA